MTRHVGLFVLLLLFAVGSPPNSCAVDVPLTVWNREAVAKDSEPITTGVPFAEGILRNAAQVRLLSNSTEIPAQFLPTAYWPDGSIRWLLVDFQSNLAGSGSSQVVLQTGAAPAAISGITVDDQPETLTINIRAATFTFTKSELSLSGTGFQVASRGRNYRAIPVSAGWTVEERGPMKVVVRVEGNWFDSSNILVNNLHRFRARLFFYRDKNWVRLYLTFCNNNSYGWDGTSGQPDLVLTGASFGIPLLPSGRSYVFGSGVEKTWELIVPASGSPALRDSRYNSDGTLAVSYSAPQPLAVASPEYYASTRAWGRISLPITGLPSQRQTDYDRFERLQRAKVSAADLENPPGLTGITLWGHLSQDINSWNDYGDQRWAGDDGEFSGNHYDWIYGMYLQFLRAGRLAFLDAARVLARHEIDFDIYHTNADGAAFNYQKNWESRPSHDNPGNDFGGGRPSHTWSQGYALHWLLTGDPRGRDGYEEVLEGVRQYVYESFNGEGYIDTNELRIAGWLTENLITLWRINPSATLATTAFGNKTIPRTIQDVLRAVFEKEAAAGGNGFVFPGDPPDSNLRQPLQNLYFLEPAIKAYEEVFQGRDSAYAATLLGLIRRMTSWVISVTFGGDSRGDGLYRPRQIPYIVDIRLSAQVEGQTPYCLMAANAAAFCHLAAGEPSYLNYARAAFQDYIRYFGVTGGDAYVDPVLRTPTSYNSNVYAGTESKIHGWSNRYGQYLLAAERSALSIPFYFAQVAVGGGFSTEFTFANTGSSTAEGNLALTDQQGNAFPVSLAEATISPQSVSSMDSMKVTGSTFTLSVPPGGIKILTASAIDPSASAKSGWARVETFGGTLGGVATFRFTESGVLKTIAGVLASQPVEIAAIPIDNDESQKRFTGFAVANEGDEDVNISLSTVNERGEVVESPLRPAELNPLGPRKQIAKFLHQYPPYRSTFRGSIVLQADGGKKFVVVALLQNQGLFTAIPVIPKGVRP